MYLPNLYDLIIKIDQMPVSNYQTPLVNPIPFCGNDLKELYSTIQYKVFKKYKENNDINFNNSFNFNVINGTYDNYEIKVTHNVNVDIKDLYSASIIVYKERLLQLLLKYSEEEQLRNEWQPIICFRYNNKTIIINGDHRVVIAKLNNTISLPVTIIDVKDISTN